MYKKITLGRYQFHFGFSKLQWIDGVSSQLKDGNHMLMWDFDEVGEAEVLNELVMKQIKLALPEIYLLQSSPPNNWIAYCFKSLPWKEAFCLVASTKYVDWYYVKYSLVRGYFTLRLGKKHGVEPKLFCKLPSQFEDECKLEDIVNYVKYETKADRK